MTTSTNMGIELPIDIATFILKLAQFVPTYGFECLHAALTNGNGGNILHLLGEFAYSNNNRHNLYLSYQSAKTKRPPIIS